MESSKRKTPSVGRAMLSANTVILATHAFSGFGPSKLNTIGGIRLIAKRESARDACRARRECLPPSQSAT
eukprot:1061360-Pleurochrysis_carterae.AAC.1